MADLPLVLLHAYPLDARMWNAVRGPLSAHTRVITPDQRGMGRSPFPESDAASEPSLDDAARDVVALLDRLELDRVVLGGCSMGGYLTMAVLRAAPERVGGLVLVDTKAEADGDEARANRLSVAERAESEGIGGWLADAMVPNLLSGHTREHQPEVAALVRELIESQQPAGVAWAQRAMAARPDSTDTLRQSDVPALVLVGQQDGLTPPDAARAMVDALPDARLVEIPNAGHLTPLEAPDAVATAITDWYPAG
ncbi:alpha/beta fold hydrolase [Prauserella rugosa]|uniref:Pimeloyl-ACP methyl ester carboxylesterase n=1 Tax=Prauserella rugosa TaxID=43354 RepID=A0A660CMQ3_9PSEU|nr:alpha/beta fold hydrolase [Prauserella rugosa]KMS89873.1 alpha/beta hydrolase [Streptomyces regensis]TWH22979.1 pimeloyl-ACP methyl ester carboxylesterase [Prauserella rugosa]